MEVLIVLLGVGILVTAGILWRTPARRSTPNDLRRAGEPDSLEPQEAVSRAEGTTAWTRMGGSF